MTSLQKQELCDIITRFSRAEKIQVLVRLKQEKIKIIEHGDGCRVNLELIPLDQFQKIYQFIKTISIQ
jgi:hypothetical protein